MAQTVVGMFDDSSEAQQAVQALVNAGFDRNRIDYSANSNTSGSTHLSSERSHNDEHESGITRFFKNLFGDDDDDAHKYSTVASKTNSIVTVHAQDSDEAERAADILDDNGAVDVDEKATQYGYSGGSSGNYSGTGSTMANTGDSTSIVGDYDTDRGSATSGLGFGSDTTSDRATSDRTDSTSRDSNFSSDSNYSNDDSRKIPIIEENIEIGKREVNSGGVRVRSRIVERPVEESIRLREERVNVERNSVDRPATESDLSSFEETEIEMVERSEVPVVNKQARVVEEVSLNKEVEERTETVHDTVRKTEVDVDDLDRDSNMDRTDRMDRTDSTDRKDRY